MRYFIRFCKLVNVEMCFKKLHILVFFWAHHQLCSINTYFGTSLWPFWPAHKHIHVPPSKISFHLHLQVFNNNNKLLDMRNFHENRFYSTSNFGIVFCQIVNACCAMPAKIMPHNVVPYKMLSYMKREIVIQDISYDISKKKVAKNQFHLSFWTDKF